MSVGKVNDKNVIYIRYLNKVFFKCLYTTIVRHRSILMMESRVQTYSITFISPSRWQSWHQVHYSIDFIDFIDCEKRRVSYYYYFFVGNTFFQGFLWNRTRTHLAVTYLPFPSWQLRTRSTQSGPAVHPRASCQAHLIREWRNGEGKKKKRKKTKRLGEDDGSYQEQERCQWRQWRQCRAMKAAKVMHKNVRFKLTHGGV